MVVLILSMGTTFNVSPVNASTSYTVHSPIQIIGNPGFTQQSGVIGGTGTRSDPYMIEGWSIAAANGQAAIDIESTTAYFLILNVQLPNAQPGIYLKDVANGSVENSTLTNSDFGIRIESSTNITISGNSISGYYGGVYVGDVLSAPQTTGLTIVNNTFSGAGATVWSSQSLPSNLNITGNTFLLTGVSTTSYGATVVGNNITGAGLTPGDLTVEGNSSVVSDNLVTGGDIQVWGSGTVVTNNSADRILLDVATAVTVSDNVLTRGVLMPTSSPFDTPSFYDSHTMTGNTVNGRPLLYFARCSGVNIDGTVVGEVIVASCTNVRVANLQLSGTDEEIMMVYVHQASIVGNNVSGDIAKSIDVLRSSDVMISSNHINGTEVSISDSVNVTVTGNLGNGGSYNPLVTLSGCSGISVSNNTLESNVGGAALNLVDVINATVTGNWVSDNGNGIVVSGAEGLNITANDIVRNQVGLTLNLGSLRGIFNDVIYHNNFVDNSQHQAAYQPYVVASFDNGYPSGGNYWSDYVAVDNCSGPQQNICSGPDGIGDAHYAKIWREFAYEYPGAYGTLLDYYPLVNPYGSISWDTASPSWLSGSTLAVAIVNSTSLTLHWTGAVDDAWVSGYRVYRDDNLVASLPGYVQSQTVTGLSPGSTHTFKVEAGDPAQNWSTDGPSASATLPQNGTSSNQPFFALAWWTEHWYLGILIGGIAVLAVAGIFLVRRKKL